MKANQRTVLNETQMRELRGGDGPLATMSRNLALDALVDGSRDLAYYNYVGNQESVARAGQLTSGTPVRLPTYEPIPIRAF